ncbi:MAG: hypothetical protein AAF495_01175 [Pseudomonadota bacterium]
MSARESIEHLRAAVTAARDGRALANEIQERVEQLNGCLADAAALGLKIECQVAETHLNALEDRDARVPVWRVKCCVYQELGK